MLLDKQDGPQSPPPVDLDAVDENGDHQWRNLVYPGITKDQVVRLLRAVSSDENHDVEEAHKFVDACLLALLDDPELSSLYGDLATYYA